MNNIKNIRNIKHPNNNIKSNTNIDKKLIIKYAFIACSVVFIIYLLFSYYIYYTTVCTGEKKTFGYYLIDYTDKDVCLNTTQSDTTQSDINISNEEVFHISNQIYTYDQAKCKCASYGARLATKDEIINAYNNGAEWDSYGWSENKTAYYIIQPNCPNKEKNITGIIGGNFNNTNIRFGINCYGIKPAGSVSIPKSNLCPTPSPKDFCSLESNFDASHILSTDEIAPFNKSQWNM